MATSWRRLFPQAGHYGLGLGLLLALWLAASGLSPPVVQASAWAIAGHLSDSQGEPVADADLALFVNGDDTPPGLTE